MILSVFLAQVDSLLVASNDEFSELNRYRQIKAALERYSRDLPDSYTEDVSGDGGRYYDTSTFTNWVNEFSSVERIQYPAEAVSEDNLPIDLSPDDWDDNYELSGAKYLLFKNHAPSASESFRVTYSTPYSWSVSATATAVNQVAHGLSVNDYAYNNGSIWVKSHIEQIATHRVTAVADADNFTVSILQATIPASDFFAVCNLAASLCCTAIATRYARTTDAIIQADSADHADRSQRFRSMAKDFMNQYLNHVGLGSDEQNKAGGQFIDIDAFPDGFPKRNYVFRGQWSR